MRPTKLLQEIRKMRFEEAYEGWNTGRLTQAEAARILGVCERSFRRYMWRYEEEGLEGLIDRRLEQASNRQAPVYEAMALTDEYRRRYAPNLIRSSSYTSSLVATDRMVSRHLASLTW